MASWVGQNWQLVDDGGATASIGVTFGVGLLDEPVEHTGALSTALAALRAELARPVELATGGAALAEALAEVSTDTSTLLVRGSRETVASAWSRLPTLFTPDIIADDLLPLRTDAPVWRTDLVRRTGHNAAALAGPQGVAAASVHELARTLLPQLHPGSGRFRAVFFASEASLIGTGFPVQDFLRGSGAGTRWADGTRTGHAAVDPDPEVPESPAEQLGPPAPTAALASVLVPRSAAGLAAARVLHRQLAAAAEQTLAGHTGIHAELTGMGPDHCLVLVGDPVLGEEALRPLLETFSRTLALVPEPWVDEAMVSVIPSQARLERERQIFDLGADPAVSSRDVMQAVVGAAESLHLAVPRVLPEAGDTADPAGDPAAGTTRAPQVSLRSKPPKHPGRGRTFKTWTSGRPGPTPATAANRLVVGENAIFAGVMSAVRAPVSWQAGVDTTRALAVLEDQSGTVSILDDQFRTVSFHPLLFPRRRALQELLGQRLKGVPRLTHRTSQDRGEMERWAKRARTTSLSLKTVAAGFGVFIAVMIGLQNSAAASVTGRLAVTDTAELGNGTRITASAFEIAGPNPADPEYTVTVHVDFCAGNDTRAGKLPPETQRSVSPENFSMFDDQYSTARLVSSSGQLRPATLRRGQCATGDLVYKGPQLANPRLSYKNEAGDDVIWYRYGQVPKG
ncbi:hypothetical protein [Arthrobacter sp. B3I4]|uniref:hypothetical protein n=1 Tax=Arthrobacter sp. B3I4 TaxID=3042267 RepID=UPI0027D83A43|nr:hypothetical protein [Arthrobacter sp. B3I4]